MRVLLVGGTGPVGQASVERLLAAGHQVALAHSGAHEPEDGSAAGGGAVEHLHGTRDALLADGGPVQRWAPEVLVDSFAGGATAAKAEQLAAVARRAGAGQVVAVSSIDVYQHCADAGVDGNPPLALPRGPLPLGEGARRRAGPSPGGGTRHDNVAMEDALAGAERITVLRPGAIYGRHAHPRVAREWSLVGRVARGERRLGLPAGGTQLFHRVALERVGRAVAAAVARAPVGRWACNVGDPVDLTYGGLARVVGDRLGWQWDTESVAWDDPAADHPWNVRHPVVVDTRRLQDTLGVRDPDPLTATSEQIDWLWERRASLAAVLAEHDG